MTGSIRSASANGIREARRADRASLAQLARAQPPLPPPARASDLTLTVTASASPATPWTTVTARSNGSYPIQPSDDNNLTPYRGTWPEQGAQWV